MLWSTKRFRRYGIAAGAVVFGSACAGWDNPSALTELNPAVTFEIEAVSLETFEETEIKVSIMDGGRPMEMREAHLEIDPAGGPPVEVEMEEHEGQWEAHVTFFSPGEHHLHFRGTPGRHHLAREWGDMEVDVTRHHQVVGSYWVELAIDPAPIPEHTTAHIEFFVFDLAPGGGRGPGVATGVPVSVEVHDPEEVVSVLTVLEEAPGEYEAEFEFEDAGEYELHVTVGAAGDEGEFHVPVLAPESEQPEDNDEGDGHGHGN